MHSLTLVSAALALASLTSASPVAFPVPVPASGPSHKTFTVHQNASKPVFKNGPFALANTYNKYRKAIPANVAKAAAAAADGSVTNTPEPNDEEYLCPVSIGGQTLNLDFDTGSADLWVFSSELSASLRSGHSYYSPSKSTTSKLLSGATWSITYGDQSTASGNVYTDTVSVGATTVAGQAVEAAKKISSQFQQDTDNDGLLGLAFSSINTVSPTAQLTFFDNAKSDLQSPVFTADLKKGAPGTFDFGFIDSNKHTGSISYVSVNNAQGFWEFTGTGYGVGSSSFKKLSIDGIMDTGTTLLLLPDAVVNAYYAQVSDAQYDNSQGGYTFSCEDNLPDLTLGIGSAKFVVPGSYINFAPTGNGDTCFGGLQSNTGIGLSIYGDIFIKSQFVVFDGSASPRLGVAPKSL